MKRVNMGDAKRNLSRYVAELKPGEKLILCNRDRPVAELRSLSQRTKRKPRIGAGKGEFTVPDSFFEPMPDEWLKAFYNVPWEPESVPQDKPVRNGGQ